MQVCSNAGLSGSSRYGLVYGLCNICLILYVLMSCGHVMCYVLMSDVYMLCCVMFDVSVYTLPFDRSPLTFDAN